jgi:hypothetical protein
VLALDDAENVKKLIDLNFPRRRSCWKTRERPEDSCRHLLSNFQLWRILFTCGFYLASVILNIVSILPSVGNICGLFGLIFAELAPTFIVYPTRRWLQLVHCRRHDGFSLAIAIAVLLRGILGDVFVSETLNWILRLSFFIAETALRGCWWATMFDGHALAPPAAAPPGYDYFGAIEGTNQEWDFDEEPRDIGAERVKALRPTSCCSTATIKVLSIGASVIATILAAIAVILCYLGSGWGVFGVEIAQLAATLISSFSVASPRGHVQRAKECAAHGWSFLLAFAGLALFIGLTFLPIAQAAALVGLAAEVVGIAMIKLTGDDRLWKELKQIICGPPAQAPPPPDPAM